MGALTMALIVGLAILAVAALLGSKLKAKTRQADGAETDWPYYAKKVLTEPEQVLYHRLVKALPEHIVLSQVQMSRVLGIRKTSNFGSHLNRIAQKSLDFAICRPDTSVAAIIELDDSSHGRARRQTADLVKDKALHAAGILTIRWTTSALPTEAQIVEELDKARSVAP